jgi:hypothetical protein
MTGQIWENIQSRLHFDIDAPSGWRSPSSGAIVSNSMPSNYSLEQTVKGRVGSSASAGEIVRSLPRIGGRAAAQLHR